MTSWFMEVFLRSPCSASNPQLHVLYRQISRNGLELVCLFRFVCFGWQSRSSFIRHLSCYNPSCYVTRILNHQRSENVIHTQDVCCIHTIYFEFLFRKHELWGNGNFPFGIFSSYYFALLRLVSVNGWHAYKIHSSHTLLFMGTHGG